MSLQPPRATHVGQIWVDPITAKAFVWTGDSGSSDYWSEWEAWKPTGMRCRVCAKIVDVPSASDHLETHPKEDLAGVLRHYPTFYESVSDAASEEHE